MPSKLLVVSWDAGWDWELLINQAAYSNYYNLGGCEASRTKRFAIQPSISMPQCACWFNSADRLEAVSCDY